MYLQQSLKRSVNALIGLADDPHNKAVTITFPDTEAREEFLYNLEELTGRKVSDRKAGR